MTDNHSSRGCWGGGAVLGGVVKEYLCEEVTFAWRPELQEASHALGPKGLQKCTIFLNRKEVYP